MMRNVLDALRRVFAQPSFVVVAVILLVAAVGLNGSTQFMQLHFKKQAVPLAKPLSDVPERLGPWVQVSIDSALDREMEDTLGTDKYVFRDYVDTRLVSAQELKKLREIQSITERHRQLIELQMNNPAAVVNVGLTYYTGLVDTVAHIPDRCYIADGYEPTTYDVVSWDALKGQKGDQKVRYIVFEDQTPGRQSVARNVAYFFNCNGKYINDPIGVRRELAYLLETYGYYMKIEVQTLKLKKDESAVVMNDFLTHALPEIQGCLPDWDKLHASR